MVTPLASATPPPAAVEPDFLLHQPRILPVASCPLPGPATTRSAVYTWPPTLPRAHGLHHRPGPELPPNWEATPTAAPGPTQTPATTSVSLASASRARAPSPARKAVKARAAGQEPRSEEKGAQRGQVTPAGSHSRGMAEPSQLGTSSSHCIESNWPLTSLLPELRDLRRQGEARGQEEVRTG